MTKIEGVTEIQTDPVKRVCSFRLTKPNVDYQSQLAKFAETNEHLAGYEIQSAPTE